MIVPEDQPGFELLLSAADGNQLAWKEFALRYVRWMRGYMKGLMIKKFIPQGELRDLVQDVWQRLIAACRNPNSAFRGRTEGQFRSWIMVIITSSLNDWCRQNRGPRKLQQLAESFDLPNRADEHEEVRELLIDCFSRLVPEERKLLELTKIEGLTLAQAAAQMSITYPMAAKLLTKALRNIRGVAHERIGASSNDEWGASA